MKRIIFDVDGCLADYTLGFTTLLNTLDSSPITKTIDQPTWHIGGNNPDVYNKACRIVSESNDFWYNLESLVDQRIFDTIQGLTLNNDIYFVTARYGRSAQHQTAMWLHDHGILNPSVIVTPYKGNVALAVDATHMIDDRWINVCNTETKNPLTRAFLLKRKYNLDDANTLLPWNVVDSVHAFLKEVCAHDSTPCNSMRLHEDTGNTGHVAATNAASQPVLPTSSGL